MWRVSSVPVPKPSITNYCGRELRNYICEHLYIQIRKTLHNNESIHVHSILLKQICMATEHAQVIEEKECLPSTQCQTCKLTYSIAPFMFVNLHTY